LYRLHGPLGRSQQRSPCRCARPICRGCLARRPDGIFISPFEQGGIGPDLFRKACEFGLEGLVSKRKDRPYRAGRPKDGSRCYGAADGEGCGTLGALSNDTNGAPHVATF
jgi:hypothetical protein